MQDFKELSAFRGLDPRQRHLLGLEAMYRGPRYATVTVKGNEIPAKDWDDDVDPRTGQWIPAAHRAPMVELGVPAAIVDRLADLAVGRGRFPLIQIEGPGGDLVLDALTSDDALDLQHEADGHCVALGVSGATCFGFHRPLGPDGAPRWDPVLLPPAWCETVTVAQRDTARGVQLAEEMAHAGAPVEDTEEGLRLELPEAARSKDLLMLRHQWPTTEEVAETSGGKATKTAMVWRRRDYLVNAVVDYEPVMVSSSQTQAPRFESRPVEPHGFGVVPQVWVPARGADDGDTEGRSLIDGPVDKLTAAGDRTASFWTGATHVTGSPTTVLMDAKDEGSESDMLADAGIKSEVLPAGPKAVLQMRSRGAGKTGSVFLLEPTGGGLDAMDKNVSALVQYAYESARLTRPDPEKLSGALSGVALERLHTTDIGLVAGYQVRLEKGWRSLAVKLARAMAASGIGGIQPDALEITFTWPRIFPYTATDVREWSEALAIGIAGGFVRQETAIARLAALLEVEDPEAEAAAILERDLAALREMRDRGAAAEAEPEAEAEAE